ncbi:LysR family transcriptional regulator [Bacillus timonensis]|uniref:LysR family transcriptional regulator n=1 Tax=Bacillus timonensis TaxID=1033734 RepID=A0A4S3PVJ2_9BACI|nr:LysR family transcriptional regulator [Bacillus timonensis]THE12972.1 LysR family transcriptional regulator [Bacillus timonensis]
MDTKQLYYFIEVAKQKSFTGAAQALCLSQPTISKMVRNLEDELEVELIDRSAKKIELTVAGEIVYEEGKKILEKIDDLSSLLDDMMNLKKGKLKIGVPPLIGFLFFPKIIKGFQDLYPNISIQLVENSALKIKEAVQEGILDLGVAAIPVEEDEFDVIPIVEEEMVLFVHSSHPLANRDQISLLELKDESFVHFQDDSTLYQQVMQECINAGFRPHVTYQSIYWDFITEMVKQNLGVSIFPQSLAIRVDQDIIKAIPIVNPTIIWKIGIILKKDKYVSFAAREMVSYICSLKDG